MRSEMLVHYLIPASSIVDADTKCQLLSSGAEAAVCVVPTQQQQQQQQQQQNEEQQRVRARDLGVRIAELKLDISEMRNRRRQLVLSREQLGQHTVGPLIAAVKLRLLLDGGALLAAASAVRGRNAHDGVSPQQAADGGGEEAASTGDAMDGTAAHGNGGSGNCAFTRRPPANARAPSAGAAAADAGGLRRRRPYTDAELGEILRVR